MGQEQIELDERLLFFLGVLAQASDRMVIGMGKFPRGCDDRQALTLLRAGYVTAIRHHAPGGSEGIEYKITQKGLDAWRAYRFDHLSPKRRDDWRRDDLVIASSMSPRYAMRDAPVGPTKTGQAAAGWQPIDTAPKDGTRVLLYSPSAEEGNIVGAAWGEWTNGEYLWITDLGEGWHHPTHWAPLPAPPLRGGSSG